MQPACQADQRASGPVHLAHPVQQPTPAAQRPGGGEVPDRLLHQRAQARLHAVERPLLAGQPVLGPAVPDRPVPVLARLGDAPEAPAEDGGDLSGVQHLAEP